MMPARTPNEYSIIFKTYLRTTTGDTAAEEHICIIALRSLPAPVLHFLLLQAMRQVVYAILITCNATGP